MHKKHIGMLNVETDATIGYYLSMLARRMGVVYTVCSGDEPACVKELYDFAKICGFTVIAVGKGKNNPLDVYATPQTLADKAAEIGLNPHILTEFVDGTKTMIEMCCVANADGLRVDRRNMHGPRVTLEQLTEVFALREKGGILGREGIVDYVIGDVAPGVFVVVRHEGRIANETMRYLKIGKGPNYLLYRPYHLTNLEVPHTIAWAMLYGKASLATTSLPTTEVITIAKQDLREGERIDCLGGNMVYGGLENREISERENLLPLGLSIGAKLMEDVARGTPLTYRQVSLRDSWLLKFRKLQDSMHE